ncbi:lateral signaling target protein 2, related [Neospora caninum Liverpool]|uniref:Lateral signaling target protein 2, related n=1 Tax=Neospora caninum (strain Liverpool) TaxID=572307 RepID=F0V9Y7_NEOCL|nr:lateral signaling target protein 2, related [Neospora caninum Liverpool]CBZ50749.1 lateral signaling target protein 2, related [Neospora caninum Liverpool]|eukprot:XP_003880782.1 lateral signaling target protein 2, related [Neospora caninum Liverpool]
MAPGSSPSTPPGASTARGGGSEEREEGSHNISSDSSSSESSRLRNGDRQTQTAEEEKAGSRRRRVSSASSEANEEKEINPKNIDRATRSTSGRATDSARGADENEEGRNVDWVPSDEVTHCNHCQGLFSVTKWKHHCRACGKVFCGECSTMRIRLPDLGYFEKVRVCDDCALARASSHTLSLQEDLDVKEQINANLKLALEEKTKQLEGFRAFLLEVEGLLLAGGASHRGLSFSAGRTPGADTTAGAVRYADGASRNSQDEFAVLMQQSERSLRQLTQRLQQYEEEFEDVRLQLEELQTERDEHRSRAYQLERSVHASQMEMMQLKEVAADRDALRAVVEEQRRQLEEQRRQLSGLQQRCVTLESKSAAANSPSASARTARQGASAASLPSAPVEPYTWGSSSDRGRGLSASLSPGDTSLMKGGIFGRDAELSRRPVVVGRANDLEDLAVAFTVADGLDRRHAYLAGTGSGSKEL